ncbi:MAG: TIGR00730 family Rossman fold protein [Rhodobacteraceae bacterium]|nr:TIGR00730 family Rossman fold protein [Paracoccaceae bacterium]
MSQERRHSFRRSPEDMAVARTIPDTPQTRSPAYRLAFADEDFLTREELRPVRLQLELLKTELALDEAGIRSTIVLMGSARIPAPEAAQSGAAARLARYYEEARRLARLVTEASLKGGGTENVIVTGGGPGIMEAGNRGAAEAGGRSVGLNIVLPHEQAPNRWVTPELCFNFHYFAIRKMHFLMRARAICIFPGGFGTLDEMFESLTLIQTGRMRRVPFLLFGRAFWEGLIDWASLAANGLVAAADLELFRYVETAEEAVGLIGAPPAPAAGG